MYWCNYIATAFHQSLHDSLNSALCSDLLNLCKYNCLAQLRQERGFVGLHYYRADKLLSHPTVEKVQHEPERACDNISNLMEVYWWRYPHTKTHGKDFQCVPGTLRQRLRLFPLQVSLVCYPDCVQQGHVRTQQRLHFPRSPDRGSPCQNLSQTQKAFQDHEQGHTREL